MSARLACPLGGMGSSDLPLPPAKQRCRRQVCEKRLHEDQKRHECVKRDTYASRETCTHHKRDMNASKETCMRQKRHECVKRDMNASQKTCTRDLPTTCTYVRDKHACNISVYTRIHVYTYPQIPHTSSTQVHPRIPTHISHIDT